MGTQAQTRKCTPPRLVKQKQRRYTHLCGQRKLYALWCFVTKARVAVGNPFRQSHPASHVTLWLALSYYMAPGCDKACIRLTSTKADGCGGAYLHGRMNIWVVWQEVAEAKVRGQQMQQELEKAAKKFEKQIKKMEEVRVKNRVRRERKTLCETRGRESLDDVLFCLMA
jgi:hypothetical protein